MAKTTKTETVRKTETKCPRCGQTIERHGTHNRDLCLHCDWLVRELAELEED